MRKRTVKRSTAPTPGAVSCVHNTVHKAGDLARLILLHSEGKYNMTIDGKKIDQIWQAVPGYSDAVYFIPEDYDETSVYFVVHCKDAVDVTARKFNNVLSDIKIVAKSNLCTKEEEDAYRLESRVLKKAKTLELVFNQAGRVLPMRYNGTL